MTNLPTHFNSVEELDDFMTLPSPELVDELNQLDGDIMLLGVAGKMGLTLARLAKRACPQKRVIGVARFSNADARGQLEDIGVETVKCDLLDREAVAALEDCKNIIFMAGRKFGAEGNQSLTWAMNTHVPTLVAERFSQSRIIAFSTACVYAMTDVASGGSLEDSALTPPGEYANSCIGRERMFEYFSSQYQTPGRLVRLSYAIDMRYGVLHDIARSVWEGKPVSLAMSHANVIWQGDANSYALRLLTRTTVPTSPINISGGEIANVRTLAETFGEIFDRAPLFVDEPQDKMWLVNTDQQHNLFGNPSVPLDVLIEWTADWVRNDRESLDKPTRFEVSDGTY